MKLTIRNGLIILSVILSGVALIFKLQRISEAGTMFIASMIGVALYAIYETIHVEKFLHKVAFLLFTSGVIGRIFLYLHFPGGDILFLTTVLAILLFSIIILMELSSKADKNQSDIMFNVIFVLLLIGPAIGNALIMFAEVSFDLDIIRKVMFAQLLITLYMIFNEHFISKDSTRLATAFVLKNWMMVLNFVIAMFFM